MAIPTILLAVFVVWFSIATHVSPPTVKDTSALQFPLEKKGEDFYSVGNNKLQRSKSGLWEMYLEGNPFERGAAFGRMNQELIYEQEKAFIDQIKVLVPNESYLKLLKYGLAFFNRGMDKFITEEYLQEIYGVSFSHPDTFDFVGEKYNRVLNYHAAHDIGHAMRQYMLVGCTSFAAWDGDSYDSTLVLGRNFDFYVGDGFAKNKIVAFFSPDSGHKFMTVTWPGFIGAVSGMNEHGLTVTLNAAASAPPLTTKTPISLLAREILQYATNIDEAHAIASKRETFVSETIMIGSANDGKTVLIEKSPLKTALYESGKSHIVCSNHYQSEAFAEDEMNIENIHTSDSPYRFSHVEKLLKENAPLSPQKAAEILRNQKGIDNSYIGYGNQKAINQLIAHHSVIFKPTEKKVWVSASPYQLGEFVCYDLDSVFAKFPTINDVTPLSSQADNIDADPFLSTPEYQRYEYFRRIKSYIQWFATRKQYFLDDSVLKSFEKSNPNLYHTHELLGDYYLNHGEPELAEKHYTIALSLEIATLNERDTILKKLDKSKKSK